MWSRFSEDAIFSIFSPLGDVTEMHWQVHLYHNKENESPATRQSRGSVFAVKEATFLRRTLHELYNSQCRTTSQRYETDWGRKRQTNQLDDLVDDKMLQSKADVWVLGDSIPYWAGQRAKITDKHNHSPKNLSIYQQPVGVFEAYIGSHFAIPFMSSPPFAVVLHLGGGMIYLS